MDQVNELENAILEQANRLASEYRERAEHIGVVDQRRLRWQRNFENFGGQLERTQDQPHDRKEKDDEEPKRL